MKETFLKHALSLLLCLTIIGISILPIHATTTQISSFFGTITATNSTVDLSNIEVKVYSAEFVDAKEENALDYYAETYAFSVFTNEYGEFHFTKPATYCSISIGLASLPSGYGISQRTQFIRPQKNEITFTISPIASIDTNLSNNEIEVTLLNAVGEEIHAEYTVTATDQSQQSHISTTAQDFQIFTKDLTSIDAINSYTYSGIVNASGFSVPYFEVIDLSNFATDAKVDFLYSEGLLTEEQRITYYCELLASNEYTISGRCGTPLVGKLTEYTNSEKIRSNTVLTRQIDTVLQQENTTSYGEPYTLQITGTKYPLFTFYIYYVEGQIDDTTIEAWAEEIKNVYLYFIETNNFDVPTTDTTSLSYNIFLTDISNANGVMYPNSNNGTSYIELERTLTTEDVKHTFSHEFQHAIMFKYGISTSIWAHEAFATMSSLIYAGYDPTVASGYIGKLRAYLNNTERSIFEYCDPITDRFNYGAAVYPLYIYETFGGWTTIRTIFSNYSLTGNLFSAIDSISQISSHGNVFNGCSTYNYYPKYFYKALKTFETKFGGAEYFGEKTFDKSMAPMSSRYFEFTVEKTTDEHGVIEYGDSYSLDFTIQNTTGASGLVLNVIKWDSDSTPIIQTIKNSVPTQFTFTQENIGTGNVIHYIVVPVHTNSSGSNIPITITANYCQ